jgi:hypothetical protein
MQKKFKAVIEAGRAGGAFVTVPFDAKAVFGSARPKVTATFDGHPYRGTIAPMGGAYLLGVLKEIRTTIGKGIGDTVQVTLEADTAPREVAVPADAAKALQAAHLTTAFDALSYTHQKEYVNAIEEAKKPETRQRRIEAMIEYLRQKSG